MVITVHRPRWQTARPNLCKTVVKVALQCRCAAYQTCRQAITQFDIAVLPTAMASSAQGFADRAQSIFGALGGASDAWKLDTQQGFKPGADDAQNSSDDEDEGAGPQPLEGAAGSDEEGMEEEQKYRAQASCAYRRAFEQEQEEDEFDRQAAGGDEDSSRPLRSMQVLDDNAFDRMHSQQYMQHHRAAHVPDQHLQVARSAADATAATSDSAAVAAMEVDSDMPELEPAVVAAVSAPTADAQKHSVDKQQQQVAAQQPEQQQQQQLAKRHRTGFGQVWVPPHRREEQTPDEGAAEGQQQQQPEQRRVRFADSRAGQQQQQHSQQGPKQPQGHGWSGQQRSRGRGRGRGSFVPDHVKHPQKYTVYTLDEPLYVGQGGDDDAANERAAAAAGELGRQAAGRGVRTAADQPGSNTVVEESAADWMQHDDEPMILNAPKTAPSAAVTEASESIPPVEPPAAGTIQFAPRSKRVCSQGAAERQPESTENVVSMPALSNAAKGLAYLQEDEPGDVSDAPALVKTSKKEGRQYRTKQHEQ